MAEDEWHYSGGDVSKMFNNVKVVLPSVLAASEIYGMILGELHSSSPSCSGRKVRRNQMNLDFESMSLGSSRGYVQLTPGLISNRKFDESPLTNETSSN